MTEAQIQAECVKWIRNERQHLRGLFFAVNNNSEHIARAMNRKASGVVPGVSDTILLIDGRAFLIEFKTQSGKQSDSQARWQRLVEANGFEYFIVRSVDEFKELINSLLER